jgi:hypothetical protein
MDPTEKALRTYDDDFLLCRNIGHLWHPVGFFRAPDGVVCRRLECARCESKRTDYWVKDTGERLQGRYTYADGYIVKTDGYAVHAVDVRLETMRRAKVYANEGAMLSAMTDGRR